MSLFIYVYYATIYLFFACHYLFMPLTPIFICLYFSCHIVFIFLMPLFIYVSHANIYFFIFLMPHFIHFSYATIYVCFSRHYLFIFLMPLFFMFVMLQFIYVSHASIYLHFLCQYLLWTATLSIVNCVIERNLRLLVSLRINLRVSQGLHNFTVVWNWPSYNLHVNLHLSLFAIFIVCLTKYSWQNYRNYKILNLHIFNYIFLVCCAVFLAFDDKYILFTQADSRVF